MLDWKGEKTAMEVKVEREAKSKEKHLHRQIPRAKSQQEWRRMRQSGRASQKPPSSSKLKNVTCELQRVRTAGSAKRER